MFTPDDPIITEIRNIFRPLSMEQRERLRSLRFVDYCQDRRAGLPVESLVNIYPRAEAFEKMYQDNQQAAIADDCFCPGCGARGHVVLCSACCRP